MPNRAAELAGAIGITILRTALERWIHDPTEQPRTGHVHETIDELRSLTAERTAAAQT